MKRIYIAGPMTGMPDFNYPAFFKAAQDLTDAGMDPINPARQREDLAQGTSSWLDFMRASLHDLATADGIALLPGWWDSRGARLEQQIGAGLGLPTEALRDWLLEGDA